MGKLTEWIRYICGDLYGFVHQLEGLKVDQKLLEKIEGQIEYRSGDKTSTTNSRTVTEENIVQNEGLENKIELLERINSQYETKMGQLETKNKDLESKIKVRDQQIVILQKSSKAGENTISSEGLQTKLLELQRINSQYDTKMEDLETKIKIRDQEIVKFQKMFDNYEENITNIRREYDL